MAMSIDTSKISQLREHLFGLEKNLSQYEYGLHGASTQGRAATIEALEAAVGAKLFKVALFVHGALDVHDSDGEKRTQVLAQLVESFKKASQLGEAGWRTMSIILAEIKTLESRMLPSLKYEIDEQLQALGSDIHESEIQRERLKAEQQRMRYELEKLSSQMRALRDAAEQTDVNPPLDFGAWLGAGPFVGQVRGMMQAESARNRLAQAERELSHAQSVLYDLQRRQQELDIRSQALAQMRALVTALVESITPVLAAAQTLTDRAETALKAMADLRMTTSLLSDAAEQVRNAADADNADTKEFSLEILQVCQLVMIDSRLTDEVSMVVDEVERGGVPPEVADRIREVREKVQSFTPAPFGKL